MLDFFLDDFYISNELLETQITDLEFCVLDFETTGLYPYNGDQIVEVGMVRTSSSKIIRRYESFINPRIPIPEAVSKINNITDDMVANAPFIEDKIDEIINFANNSVIVAHNLSFDLSFLNFQLQKMNQSKLNHWLVDTIKVAKIVLTDLERYSLEHITKCLKIKNKESHRALSDAEATAKVLHCLLERLPGSIFKDLLPFKIR